MLIERDVPYLLPLLPPDWREQARTHGALHRRRKIVDAETLLRILLIHLAEGASLRQTARAAVERGLADVSDITVRGRLRQSADWFQWLNTSLLHNRKHMDLSRIKGLRHRPRVMGSATIREPRRNGRKWNIDYAFDLPSLVCENFAFAREVMHAQEVFTRRLGIQPGDIMLGSNAYASIDLIPAILQCQAHVILPFSAKTLTFRQISGRKFDLRAKLDALHDSKAGDWEVLLTGTGSMEIAGRICGIRKSRQAFAASLAHAHTSSGDVEPIGQAGDSEAAAYVYVFTSIPSNQLSTHGVLELYRHYWQLEALLTRFNSLLGKGFLPEGDPEARRAWIHGKILVALLTEELQGHGRNHSPWGYPLLQAADKQQRT
jgi:hypothetical protein